MNDVSENDTSKNNFWDRGKTPAGAENKNRRGRKSKVDLCEAKRVKMKQIIPQP